MVVLGSTTLYEMRENVLAASEHVPKETRNVDEDEEDGYKGEREGQSKRNKWTNERRVTGSVWGIDGVLYPDLGEGKTNYAQ